MNLMEKSIGNSVEVSLAISWFTTGHPTPQVLQTRSYTFTNFSLGRKHLKSLEVSMTISFLNENLPQRNKFLRKMIKQHYLQSVYTELHVFLKTHITFSDRSHWLQLWRFLIVSCSRHLKSRSTKSTMLFQHSQILFSFFRLKIAANKRVSS